MIYIRSSLALLFFGLVGAAQAATYRVDVAATYQGLELECFGSFGCNHAYFEALRHAPDFTIGETMTLTFMVEESRSHPYSPTYHRGYIRCYMNGDVSYDLCQSDLYDDYYSFASIEAYSNEVHQSFSSVSETAGDYIYAPYERAGSFKIEVHAVGTGNSLFDVFEIERIAPVPLPLPASGWTLTVGMLGLLGGAGRLRRPARGITKAR